MKWTPQQVCQTLTFSEVFEAEREIAREVKENLRYSGANYDNELKSTAESTRRKSMSSQTEISSLSALNVSIALKCGQPGFTGKEASGIHDTSFRCFMKSDSCTPMSCRQVARPCSRELSSA